MKKQVFGILFSFALWSGLCIAQSNEPQAALNWGKSINGVQLSVDLTTNVFATGSSTAILAWIKNSSTNAIYIAVSNPRIDFKIELTDAAGRTYLLTGDRSHFPIASRNFRMKIQPGEIDDFRIPVVFDKTITPGNYTLKAATSFSASISNFELFSGTSAIKILEPPK